jgi:hypothetical protein
MKQEPILAYENSFEIDRLTAMVHDRLAKLNAVVDEFHQLGLGQVTNTELFPLVTKTTQFVKDKTLSTIVELPSYGGFKMKPEAFLDTLELPDLSGLYEACRGFKKQCQNIQYDMMFYRMKGKVVEINSEILRARIDAFRIYAATPKEQGVFNAYQALIDAYGLLDGAVRQYVAPGGLDNFNLQRLIEKDHKGKFTINENVYRQLCGKF